MEIYGSLILYKVVLGVSDPGRMFIGDLTIHEVMRDSIDVGVHLPFLRSASEADFSTPSIL